MIFFSIVTKSYGKVADGSTITIHESIDAETQAVIR